MEKEDQGRQQQLDVLPKLGLAAQHWQISGPVYYVKKNGLYKPSAKQLDFQLVMVFDSC